MRQRYPLQSLLFHIFSFYVDDFSFFIHTYRGVRFQKYALLVVKGGVCTPVAGLLTSVVKHPHVMRITPLDGSVKGYLFYKRDVVTF